MLVNLGKYKNLFNTYILRGEHHVFRRFSDWALEKYDEVLTKNLGEIGVF